MPDFSVLKQVSRKRLERTVWDLSTKWPSRHTLSRGCDLAANYLSGMLVGAGWRSSTPTYKAPGGKDCYNVVAELGPKNPRSTVIFCAHFDSRQERMNLPDAPAPGADDNATGVAALLEIALLVRKLPLKDRVVIALFSGEEQGFWGSTAFSKVVQKPPIRFVFNLDQVGYPMQKGEKFLFVDIDQKGRKANNAESARLVARCQELAKTVVNVPTKVDPAENSDYDVFERLGVPIIGLYEGEEHYPNYHKSTDTADKVDYAYLTDMTRLALAFLLDQCS